VIGCGIPGCPCPHSGAGMNPRSETEIENAIMREVPTPGLTQVERLAVFAALNAKGRSARAIAHVVCVAERTVVRWRRALELTEVSS
jgi:hypothetical protein